LNIKILSWHGRCGRVGDLDTDGNGFEFEFGTLSRVVVMRSFWSRSRLPGGKCGSECGGGITPKKYSRSTVEIAVFVVLCVADR
jgi:hypothetical protein